MELKLGAKITALRKTKGMTQEQLAAALGISSPAVSKWETDNSYPDITLLCPLARALGTDVDTLLGYEEMLSEEQSGEYIRQIIEEAEAGNIPKAENRLQELLHQYPASIALKYHAVAALTMIEIYNPSCTEEQKEKWKEQKKALCHDVYISGASPYYEAVVSSLIAIALADDKLEEAENYLKELPECPVDTIALWVQLYVKRGENEKALEMLQKHLYRMAGGVQTCLSMMMREALIPDTEKVLEICEIYRKTEEIFTDGVDMSNYLFAEAYLRAGRKEEALKSLLVWIDEILSGTLHGPNPILFSPAFKTIQENGKYRKELMQQVLRGMLLDESLEELRDEPEFQMAIEKIKTSISTLEQMDK